MDIVPPELEKILRETPHLKRAFPVGGCVRDALLQRSGMDFDIEVYGLGYEDLVKALVPRGRTDLVGRSFGVVKLNTGSGFSYDFTLPRQDSKVGPGHKGFDTQFDPEITPEKAASRRDFTINSLMYDPRDKKVLDFVGGIEDLRNKILRHTSEAFPEDPLRVLRGMQFASRFDLTPDAQTVALCRSIKHSYPELAGQRVRDEWFKWAALSATPSRGLRFLIDTEWAEHFPEILAMVGTPQDPEWHPEGDVFVHTCHCCDAMARIPEWIAADAESRIVYMLAILAHDFGKAPTTHTAMHDGRLRIVSPGHEAVSGQLAKVFLARIQAPLAIQERVIPLAVNHLIHFQTLTDRAMRRLAKRLEPENIEGLGIVMTADAMGRPPKKVEGRPAHVEQLLAWAHRLEVKQKPPTPILMGRHLIETGMPPGPAFNPILEKAYEAQLEGAFFDLPQALAWLENEMKR
jgi:tRNA nucleotidyltransferase (CCA-adding enzyme)